MTIDENLSTRLPDHLILELDKGVIEPLSGKLPSKVPTDQNMGKEKKPIIRTIIIDYDSIPDYLIPRKLDAFDLIVHDAVFTFWECGRNTFTLASIIKVISGKTGLNPTKTMEERVR